MRTNDVELLVYARLLKYMFNLAFGSNLNDHSQRLNIQ